MRNLWFLPVLPVVCLSLLRPLEAGGVGERPWSVGYAEAEITPPLGQVHMTGFGNERYASGVLAPLLTQVVALRDQDGATGLLITADILDFDRVMVEAIRRDLQPQKLVIVGHACHPTSSGLIQMWTPDYPGGMRDYLSREGSDVKALFVQGCGGDAGVVHEDPETGSLVFSADPVRAREAGEMPAQAVLAHLETGKRSLLAGKLTCVLATGQISFGAPWSQEGLERPAYGGPKRSEEEMNR